MIKFPATIEWLGWARTHALTLVGFAVLSLSTWVFLELADDAPEGDYLEIENRILLALRSAEDPERPIGPSWLLAAARDVTALGGVFVLLLVSVLSAGFLLLRGRHRTALLLLLSVVGGYLVNSTLKGAFRRSRPDVVPHLVEESSLSFPSGHSMLSAVIYLTLGALLAQSVGRHRERVYLFAVAVSLTVMIGVSRVYLGVHYPTDVLAGWSLGLAWALVCWSVQVWLQERGTVASPADAGHE